MQVFIRCFKTVVPWSPPCLSQPQVSRLFYRILAPLWFDSRQSWPSMQVYWTSPWSQLVPRASSCWNLRSSPRPPSPFSTPTAPSYPLYSLRSSPSQPSCCISTWCLGYVWTFLRRAVPKTLQWRSLCLAGAILVVFSNPPGVPWSHADSNQARSVQPWYLDFIAKSCRA